MMSEPQGLRLNHSIRSKLPETSPNRNQQTLRGSAGSAVRHTYPSPALEWMWNELQEVRRPQILDCGPVCQATIDVWFRRHAKIYVADLVTPLLQDESQFWERKGKVSVFRIEDFLNRFPAITPGTVSGILGWHLLDLLPREAHQDLFQRWFSFLHPGGVLFCLLREPRLEKGSEVMWWLENPTVIGSALEGRRLFPYPVITNREMERLAPAGSVKIFLTRSGRREVLVGKPG